MAVECHLAASLPPQKLAAVNGIPTTPAPPSLSEHWEPPSQGRPGLLFATDVPGSVYLGIVKHGPRLEITQTVAEGSVIAFDLLTIKAHCIQTRRDDTPGPRSAHTWAGTSECSMLWPCLRIYCYVRSTLDVCSCVQSH